MLVIKCHNIEKLIIYCRRCLHENVSNKMSQHWKAYNIL